MKANFNSMAEFSKLMKNVSFKRISIVVHLHDPVDKTSDTLTNYYNGIPLEDAWLKSKKYIPRKKDVEGDLIPLSILYSNYCAFCISVMKTPLGRGLFSKYLKKSGFKSIQRNTGLNYVMHIDKDEVLVSNGFLEWQKSLDISCTIRSGDIKLCIQFRDLYDSYVEYCIKNDIEYIGSVSFSKFLFSAGFERTMRNGSLYYYIYRDICSDSSVHEFISRSGYRPFHTSNDKFLVPLLSDFYIEYENWCKEIGIDPLWRPYFTAYLEKQNFTMSKRGSIKKVELWKVNQE